LGKEISPLSKKAKTWAGVPQTQPPDLACKARRDPKPNPIHEGSLVLKARVLGIVEETIRDHKEVLVEIRSIVRIEEASAPSNDLSHERKEPERSKSKRQVLNRETIATANGTRIAIEISKSELLKAMVRESGETREKAEQNRYRQELRIKIDLREGAISTQPPK
jgi:hypothetical protein